MKEDDQAKAQNSFKTFIFKIFYLTFVRNNDLSRSSYYASFTRITSSNISGWPQKQPLFLFYHLYIEFIFPISRYRKLFFLLLSLNRRIGGKSSAEFSCKIAGFDRATLIFWRLVYLFCWISAFKCLLLFCFSSFLSIKLETQLSFWTPLSRLPYCWRLVSYFLVSNSFEFSF